MDDSAVPADSGEAPMSTAMCKAPAVVVKLDSGAEDRLVERCSGIDLMELASDVGPAPMQVGAILMLGPGGRLTASEVSDALGNRIRTIPRLRQRLLATPPGCGRPIWVDDPNFAIAHHFRDLRCPSPGDETTLLEIAAGVMTDPLPPDRPLWSATLVTGLAGDTCALIVVFNHVLADGMGGLAVLANLVDRAAGRHPREFPRPRPSWRQLARDAAASRIHTVTNVSAVVARLRDALREIRPGDIAHAPRCSLNRPVGSRRRFGVIRADLAEVRSIGHAHGGTVNDVILTTVSGALNTLLAYRGEYVDHFVASVPISARAEADVTQLGNQIGVISVTVPAAGRPLDRLEAIAGITRLRRTRTRGSSAAILAPVHRVLAMLHVLRWCIEHQHLVTTFVTNLRGPADAVSFLGSRVSEVIPLGALSGNVSVAFAVLSYAGTLTVTITVDDDAFPDFDVLLDALQVELDAVTTPAVPVRKPAGSGPKEMAGEENHAEASPVTALGPSTGTSPSERRREPPGS